MAPSTEAVRTHVVFSRDLVETIDRVAGKRKRSEFIAEAVREKLTRELQRQAFEEAIGSLVGQDYPDWETPEKTSAWIRWLRSIDNDRLERKLRGSRGS